MVDRDVIITDAQGNEEEKTANGKLRLVPEATSHKRIAKMQKVIVEFVLIDVDGNG